MKSLGLLPGHGTVHVSKLPEFLHTDPATIEKLIADGLTVHESGFVNITELRALIWKRDQREQQRIRKAKAERAKQKPQRTANGKRLKAAN